jgi:hypothetical protein
MVGAFSLRVFRLSLSCRQWGCRFDGAHRAGRGGLSWWSRCYWRDVDLRDKPHGWHCGHYGRRWRIAIDRRRAVNQFRWVERGDMVRWGKHDYFNRWRAKHHWGCVRSGNRWASDYRRAIKCRAAYRWLVADRWQLGNG